MLRRGSTSRTGGRVPSRHSAYHLRAGGNRASTAPCRNHLFLIRFVWPLVGIPDDRASNQYRDEDEGTYGSGCVCIRLWLAHRKGVADSNESRSCRCPGRLDLLAISVAGFTSSLITLAAHAPSWGR